MGMEDAEDKYQVPDMYTLRYAFIDTEVGLRDHKIHDIGVLRHDGSIYHSASRDGAIHFVRKVNYLCGHNIVHHDAKFLFPDGQRQWMLVDTLYMSPLLFPERPYHKLLKDDKLLCEQANNPVNDCEKARDLLMDEIAAWGNLSQRRRSIFTHLLKKRDEFEGFLQMVGAKDSVRNLTEMVTTDYEGLICSHADIKSLAENHPCELAYALAMIGTTERSSITPGWVLHQYPAVEYVLKYLRQKSCGGRCAYCKSQLDIHQNLKDIFGYDNFRTYEGEPLQEQACQAAVDGKSLLAIFPTGGGKSLTFQLPALMAGRTEHGLTVVISPLLSLMKDQVDNLAERGITEVATINGLLDPITRANSIERIKEGEVSLLYIAPEMLRSHTLRHILLGRNVVRFVIDEAHCFSSWGQDFRVDYLYIARFIKEYQEAKQSDLQIPISCFTATAKPKVIQDICDYFQKNLGIHLELFTSSASRTNLQYSVIHTESDEDKYMKLRSLISTDDRPTIVYVSRTKRTRELAEKLRRDGFKALPFNGRMEADEKIANQEAFMNDRVRIIVATSAFGMGVDKSDVGLVIHYDISDSLENYVQEAGRAGRDPNLEARCYVLYGDEDLDKHFILLNQTKLSQQEINQVWQAIKRLAKQRSQINKSALEIAREARWDDSVTDIETRVRSAISALEQAGYIERGCNMPFVRATGITVKNMEEARIKLSSSRFFTQEDIDKAARIIQSLLSKKYTSLDEAEAESRIDYLADTLGMTTKEVSKITGHMVQAGILANNQDISAYLMDEGCTEHRATLQLERFAKLERFIIEHTQGDSTYTSYKQLNEEAINEGIKTAKEKDIKTIFYFLSISGYISRKNTDGTSGRGLSWRQSAEQVLHRFERRIAICRFAVERLYQLASESTKDGTENTCVCFSVVEILNQMKEQGGTLFPDTDDLQQEEVKEALLYLNKIDAIRLEGGFLVIYNAMNIRKLKDNRLQYKQEDYRLLNEFYRQKMQQIHIVGEYANLMVKDYNAALAFVQDYFQMDYKLFMAKHFKGERKAEVERGISPKKYKQIMGELSDRQKEIIADKTSRCIVVAAGPGSGKTRVLVHKLASLLIMEDVKHEQLLMLTFSRAAATEFKQRLHELIGNAANFVEIKTFHSYCFDLIGRMGNLDDAGEVVTKATEMIKNGEVEPCKIGKTALVIDEAQDMDAEDYAPVKALMDVNEGMRVIAVGDDDQNIYDFRGANSEYMYRLTQEPGARFMEMTENYRSSKHVVQAANSFVHNIRQRMKSTPILPMTSNEGHVSVFRHASAIIYQPVIEDILQQHEQGSTCVLTQTNEEAVTLVALLHRHGLKSRLIQSMDGLRMWNLAEIRYFLKQLKYKERATVITDMLWDYAKCRTFSKYATSTSLPYIKRFARTFEQLYPQKYYSTLSEFLFESSLEDFCDTHDTEITVSTIHKSKGREFDHVYIMATGAFPPSDELLRRYYVGITRAKQTLSIHTQSTLFEQMYKDEQHADTRLYPMPEEVVLQLSHKDVNLGRFKRCKAAVLSLQSGSPLTYRNGFLYSPIAGTCVAQLSQKMQTVLSEWAEKGYEVKDAQVRFIVAWKPKGAPREEEESAVLLPDLTLERKP